MSKKATRRALLSSALSLLLCASMLVGTTFAWFTDSVTSTGNIIKSGTLDVTMHWADGTDAVPASDSADWKDASDAAKPIFKYELWEPGYVEVRHIKIANVGTLALKYQLSVQATETVSDLSDAIDVYFVDPATQVADRADLAEQYKIGTLTEILAGMPANTFGQLTAGAEATVTVALKMRETAGNEYMDKSIGSQFNVVLSATQLAKEPDSFDEKYDEDAPISVMVSSVDELKLAIANAKDGEVIGLGADITEADGILLTDKNITLDLNGKTVTVSEGATTNSRAFKITGDSKVTIRNGTIVAQGDIGSGAYGTVRTEGNAEVVLSNVKLYSYRGYGLNVKANSGTKITINDSYIYAQYGGGVEAAGGTVVLNDTVIEQEGIDSSAAWCSVAIGVNGGGAVTVNSGTYSAAPITTDSNAAQGTWVAYVMSSGGDLTVNGGTFNGTVAETASAANACGIICADRAAVVEINGGTFNSNGAILDMRNNVGTQPNPVATLNGGIYSADPTVSGLYSSNLIKVGAGKLVVKNGSTWTVEQNTGVTTAAELKAALAAGEKEIKISGVIRLTEGLSATDVTFVGATAGAGIDFNGNNIGGSGTVTYKDLALTTIALAYAPEAGERYGWYGGIDYMGHSVANYINCDITGVFTTYSQVVNATDTTFNYYVQDGEEYYGLFMYRAGTVNAKDCTFLYGDRAIKIYSEGPADFELNIKGGQFKATDSVNINKALINVDSTYLTNAKITVKGVTVDDELATAALHNCDGNAKVNVSWT